VDFMLNYPAGHTSSKMHQKEIYNNKPKQSYASRGMSLEDRLNQSNDYYLKKGLAVIHKKPTPVQVVKVNYPKRSAAKITEAYFRNASTTDYNGVYKNHYIISKQKKQIIKLVFHLQTYLSTKGFICANVLNMED